MRDLVCGFVKFVETVLQSESFAGWIVCLCSLTLRVVGLESVWSAVLLSSQLPLPHYLTDQRSLVARSVCQTLVKKMQYTGKVEAIFRCRWAGSK